ncbi:MAG: hypothetical protein NTW78_07365 [Campylobacterales bacterium]|nr:hypothetical protein [Campylobacterales bacterium]
MDVSSSTAGSVNSSTQVEALKKAMDVQEKSVLKVLDSANEQAKQVTAQKTGVGNNLNLTA